MSPNHALLLQPVSDTGATLPVVTGSVQNSILVGTFDDTVEGDEGDLLSDQSFLTSLSGVFQCEENNTDSVTVGDDGLNLVDLLFTGGSGHVNTLVLAGSSDLCSLLFCVGTSLCSPAVVGSGAQDVNGLSGSLFTAAAGSEQAQNHDQNQSQR